MVPFHILHTSDCPLVLILIAWGDKIKSLQIDFLEIKAREQNCSTMFSWSVHTVILHFPWSNHDIGFWLLLLSPNRVSKTPEMICSECFISSGKVPWHFIARLVQFWCIFIKRDVFELITPVEIFPSASRNAPSFSGEAAG